HEITIYSDDVVLGGIYYGFSATESYWLFSGCETGLLGIDDDAHRLVVVLRDLLEGNDKSWDRDRKVYSIDELLEIESANTHIIALATKRLDFIYNQLLEANNYIDQM